MYIPARPFPSFETPVEVQFPALNVMSLIVVYSKAITFTFKNELARKKKETKPIKKLLYKGKVWRELDEGNLLIHNYKK